MNARHADNLARKKPVVLVTGAAGLIGNRLIQQLAGQFTCVGIDLESPDESSPHITWIHCDLTSDESIRQALGQVRAEFGDRIASVVHLAAYYDFSGEPSPLYRDLTVEGTRRLLRQLQSFHVEQFVFSSSLLVMKPTDDDRPLSADSPEEAEWDYPQSKLAAERVIADERGEIPAVILRLAGVYDEDCRSIPIAQQISRIYEKQLESYFFPGNKTHGQAFVHLDDAIECICLTIEKRRELSGCEVFLIGEEDVMSYAELQEELGKLIHGRAWPTIRIPKAVAKAGAWIKDKFSASDHAPFIKPWMIDLADQNYPVSISEARRKLGWEPRHSLRLTLPEMIGRLHFGPVRWYEINGLPLPEFLDEDAPALQGGSR